MMIFITILQLIAALILILVVLFQSGKSQGLSGAIGGIADSYMAKSKAKSLDAKLAKGTKWVGRCVYHPDPGHQLHAGRRYRRVSVSYHRITPKRRFGVIFYARR